MKKRFRKGISNILHTALCIGILAGLTAASVSAEETAEENRNVCRIACIGDSITYGFGFERPEEEAYPALLQSLLGDDYEVLSYSGNGYALTDAGINFFETEEYYWSLQANADIYVIMLGSNDSYMQPWDPVLFKDALEKLLSAYEKTSPNCRFLFAAPPHDFAMETFIEEADEIYEEIVQIFKDTAEARGAAYLDLFAATEDKQDLYQGDLVHPNAEGQALIAELLKETIEEMQKPFEAVQ